MMSANTVFLEILPFSLATYRSPIAFVLQSGLMTETGFNTFAVRSRRFLLLHAWHPVITTVVVPKAQMGTVVVGWKEYPDIQQLVQ